MGNASISHTGSRFSGMFMSDDGDDDKVMTTQAS